MAKKTLPVAKSKVTFTAGAKDYDRFKRKCKKAKVSASERLRQLIAQDLKV